MSKTASGAAASLGEPARDELPLLKRLQSTPARDLLRGRVTARWHLGALLHESGLSISITALIRNVIRNARLWRAERIDVANELIAHFQDGLAHGQSADELVRVFGNPKQAAILIRRAKKRNRPLWWRTWRRSAQSVGVFLLAIFIIYAGITLRYLTGSPTITHDFIAMMNERIADVEEDDRAWPLYRSAMMSMREDERLFRIRNAKPGDDEWPELIERLGNHREALEMIRHASTKPVLGVEFVAERDAEKRDQLIAAGIPSYDPDDSMVSHYMPHIGQLRTAAMFLVADVHVAHEENDHDRLIENLRTTIRLAEHLREQSILLEERAASFVLKIGMDEFKRVLAEHPAVFTDDDLRDFAHQYAVYSGGGRITIRFEGERMLLRDLIQNTYTDDGAGGGRATPEAIRLIKAMVPFRTSACRDVERLAEPLVAVPVTQPILATMLADRRELTRMKNTLFGLLASEAERPPWERGQSEFRRTVEELLSMRYLLIVLSMSGFSDMLYHADYLTQHRDAVLAAIALELYRREHGDWPASLDALGPRFLPDVPRDRFDGGPIKYRLTDGEPVLYSVGSNRTDNGGRPTKDRDGKKSYEIASRFMSPHTFESIMAKENDQRRRFRGPRIPDGDWILWTKVSLLPDEPSDIGIPSQ